jgi:serpin B
MKYYHLLLFILLIQFATACNKDNPGKENPTAVPIELTAKAAEVIQNSNAFGIDVFRAVAADDTDVNLMISPLSASAALTMLLNGCDGETYNQIKNMLGYNGMTTGQINEAYQSLVSQLLVVDPKVEIALANAVWYRQDFVVKPPFVDDLQTAFNARVEGLDFTDPSALETMNQWASDNTNGKIPQVLNEISGNAVMFLMNALYFKGSWTQQFNPNSTFEGTFSLDDGSEITTPLMMGRIPIITTSGNGYFAFEMFYGQQNFSMIVIVPESGLDEFVQGMNSGTWEEITESLDNQPGPVDVQVIFPRFSFEYEKKLNEILQSLGMTDAFNSVLANLSGISDQDIFVSFVKQNTFVEVNEDGTEAAAVTTIGIELTSIGDEPVSVHKPFIFAIREQTTNSLLFIGKVVNPLL